MADKIEVRISDLTTQQLLVYLVRLNQQNQDLLLEVRDKMTDLSQSVEDLKAAVDGVAQRLLPQIAALEEALAQAQADDADAAQIAADAEAAVQSIRQEVDRLNALGADPSTPVDTEPSEPVEPPEVEVPADPDAPHPDQTLPGDLPQ